MAATPETTTPTGLPGSTAREHHPARCSTAACMRPGASAGGLVALPLLRHLTPAFASPGAHRAIARASRWPRIACRQCRWLLLAWVLLPLAAIAADPADLAHEIGRGAHRGIEAVLVEHDGTRLVEAHAPGDQGSARDLRSVTKSVTALVVGIAIDRGLIRSVETPVADLLPEIAPVLRADPLKARMTVADLLTMRSGLDCDDWDPASPGHEDRMYRRRDWLAFWAATTMRDAPGARFSYCTGNAIALGRIVEVASGRPFDDFAQELLFSPLGIPDARWAKWKRGTRTDTGGHLALSPDALARIGRLLLENGRIGERRLLSEAWIRAMTTEWVSVPGLQQRYGYLWWLDATRAPEQPRVRLWMAWGNGGNFLIALPDLDAVAVFTGTRYNAQNALEPLLWLRDRVMPALRAMQTPPRDAGKTAPAGQ